MCTKAAEMYGSAILNRRGSVGYSGFRARAVRGYATLPDRGYRHLPVAGAG